MPKVASEILCALILDDNFHPLLTLRPDNVFRPQLWAYPSGRRLPDEPIATALRRIVAQTTSLAVEPGTELATQTFAWEALLTFRLISTHTVQGVAQPHTADDLGYFDPLFAVKYKRLTPEAYGFYAAVATYIEYVGNR